MPEPRYHRCEVDAYTVFREELIDGAWQVTRTFYPVPLDPDTTILPAELAGVFIESV
ncbi:hypothetical protein [Pseudoxanthomonas winnipegensis]|uniref:hypothetical protein n=1 Tax=Pseudoxanthomonas winnipegensis TaxID=2480810 RepID=UPI0013EF552C|nr:hypothetical protein [Pseudoxanthomonas winnipegensis]